MKMKDFLHRIPKPVRACFWAVAAVLMAVVYYIVLGCPTITLRQEFRRAEKVNMVGPSKIVDMVLEYYDFNQLFIGETEDGICFFGRYGARITGGKHSGEWNYRFTYLEKTGDITVAAAPNILGFSWALPGVNLPVYVFADHPDAVRASIDITVEGERTRNVNGKTFVDPFQEQFHAEAQRHENGFFRFFLDCTDEDSGYALGTLSNLASGNRPIVSEQRNITIPVTVRLYDANGSLILERELTIGPIDKTEQPDN